MKQINMMNTKDMETDETYQNHEENVDMVNMKTFNIN